MRTKLALAALVGGIAVAVLPAAPASASCTVILDGRCVNASCLVTGVYNTVDNAVKDKLPDLACFA